MSRFARENPEMTYDEIRDYYFTLADTKRSERKYSQFETGVDDGP